MSVVHTAVVARKIRRGCERDYEEWLAKVAASLPSVAGYDGMTCLSSTDAQGSVRTMLIRFKSSTDLSNWEQSDIRHSLAKEGNRFSSAYYQTAAGLENFFAVPALTTAPPRWKMCLLTIPIVYLLVNAVLIVFSRLIPGMRTWSPEVRMVPVIPVMVVLLTYTALPAVSKIFAPWLFAQPRMHVRRNFERPNS
jgi:uncharacterized protein